MVILLTLEESEEEIISGFPEYVVLSTNIPSTIFYTLDGTDPTMESDIFVNQLYLPTDGLRRTLKAVAISGSFSSAVLEQTYFTDVTNLNKSRLIGKEGINNLPYGKEPVNYLSEDEYGNPTQGSTILFEDLDLIASTTNRFGEDIPGDTTIDFINFATKLPVPQDTQVSYLNDINFDPKAFYLIIDGTSQEAISEQTVRVINRPHDSMNSYSAIPGPNSPNRELVTANFVRYMIDPRTGKITFYYRDSRENRWIKSTQKIEGSGKNLSKSATPPNGFVFRWIENRAQSRIY